MTTRPITLGVRGTAFADNLHAARKARHLTLTRIAELVCAEGVDITPDRIELIERRCRRAHVDEVCALAKAVGVPLNRMMIPSRLELVPHTRPQGALADG